MPSTLFLDIPDLPCFDDATIASWTWSDNTNAQRHGESSLSGAPRADEVIAIAPVHRLLFIETILPAVTATKRNALLRYAIEDKLTIDPATVHAVVLGMADAKHHVVAAIDRGWLAAALQWLKDGGFATTRLVSSATALDAKPGEWAVMLGAQHGFAKRADGFVHNFDCDQSTAPPFGLTLALKEAASRNLAPRTLVLQGDGDMERIGRAWAEALHLHVRVANVSADARMQSLLAAAKTDNLLTGEFAPPSTRATVGKLFVPALISVFLIGATHLVFTLLDNGRLAQKQSAIEAEMTRLFKESFPAAQAIVDPTLQMTRNLEGLKRERGLAVESGARLSIAQLTEVFDKIHGTPTLRPAIIQQLSINGSNTTLDIMVGPGEPEPMQREALTIIARQYPTVRMDVKNENAAPALIVRLSVGSRQ